MVNHAAVPGGPTTPASIRLAQFQGHAFPTAQVRIWHRTCKHDTTDLSFGRKPQPNSELPGKGTNDMAARKQRLTPNKYRESLRVKHRTFRNPFRRKYILTACFLLILLLAVSLFNGFVSLPCRFVSPLGEAARCRQMVSVSSQLIDPQVIYLSHSFPSFV